MNHIPDGHDEVVYSQTERAGLPNWSFVNILASAKVMVPTAQAELAYSYLFVVVNAFVRERAEMMANELNMWAGVEGSMQEMSEEQKMGLNPQGITAVGNVMLTYSRTETVGLPDKSSINLLASAQRGVALGTEFLNYRNLAEFVSGQMKQKREVVVANPRPWIQGQ